MKTVFVNMGSMCCKQEDIDHKLSNTDPQSNKDIVRTDPPKPPRSPNSPRVWFYPLTSNVDSTLSQRWSMPTYLHEAEPVYSSATTI